MSEIPKSERVVLSIAITNFRIRFGHVLIRELYFANPPPTVPYRPCLIWRSRRLAVLRRALQRKEEFHAGLLPEKCLLELGGAFLGFFGRLAVDSTRHISGWIARGTGYGDCG